MPGGRRLSPAPSPGTGTRGSPGAPPNPPRGSRRLRAPELSGAGAAGLCRGGCCQPAPRGPRAARSRSPEAAARGWGHPSPGTSSPALPPPRGAGRAQAPKSHQDLADCVGSGVVVLASGDGDTQPRSCPRDTHSSSSSSCPAAQPTSSVAPRLSPPPSTSLVATEGGVTCKTGPQRGSLRVPPGGRQLGDRPHRPAEPAGSEAAVPAALAAWAACQPRPAAGLRRDSGDNGDGGGTGHPADGPGGLLGVPRAREASSLPAPVLWVPGSPRALDPAPAAADL